jgi:molybdopterin-guanine dinucleotide biosynthesis protein A
MRILARRRLVDHAVDIARAVAAGDPDAAIVIAAGTNEISLRGVRTLPDTIGAGPMAGLYSSLSTCGRTLIFPCDMPFLAPEFLRFLLAHSRTSDIVTCRFDALVQPQVGVYSEGCTPAARLFLTEGKYSLYRLVIDAGLRVCIVEEAEIARFGDPKRLFFDINTSEDIERGERIAAGKALRLEENLE